MNFEEYLTPGQAARDMGITTRSVHNYIQAGKINAIWICTGGRADGLEAYIISPVRSCQISRGEPARDSDSWQQERVENNNIVESIYEHGTRTHQIKTMQIH